MSEKGKVWEYKSNDNDNLQKLVKKEGKTIVYTNPEMAKHLISRINFFDGELVCDCCKGEGAFYDNLPDNVVKSWYEINLGRDYLTGPVHKVNTTISNPPYVPRRMFWEFMERAMEMTTDRIFWLVNLSILNCFTPKRLNEMKERSWFINNIHIVQDKRWFGRYCMIEISKKNNNFYTYKLGTFK